MTIDLSGNAISGGIPASMHLVQKLRVLNMGKNQLDGSIPQSIGNLSLLSHLDVNTNNLTGEIPEAMSRLDHIQHLQLSINSLKGIVPCNFTIALDLFSLHLQRMTFMVRSRVTSVFGSQTYACSAIASTSSVVRSHRLSTT